MVGIIFGKLGKKLNILFQDEAVSSLSPLLTSGLSHVRPSYLQKFMAHQNVGPQCGLNKKHQMRPNTICVFTAYCFFHLHADLGTIVKLLDPRGCKGCTYPISPK